MRSKIILILFFCCVLFNLKGEGTKQLRPNNADFGYINLMDQQNNLGIERTFALYNATDETRLNIRIQNPNQEKIYLGFKTNNTNTLYYRIKDPNGNILVAETLVPQTDGDNGKILNYNEAVFGPNVISAGGYKAIVVNPVVGLVGDYSIEFRDPNHNPPSNYARRYFELFDITVVNTSTNKAIDGRLWSKAWDITTTSASRGFNGATYIYTNDGITTQVGFKDFKAWSFIIQSNSTGPGNSGDVAEDRKSINGGVLLPDYKIFLTTPDASAFPTSVVPSISGTPNIDLCDPSGLYCIDINVSNAGIVEYVIDIAGGKGYDHVRDVKLVEATVSGNNCLPWDGLDGQGNPLTTLDTFDIILSYQAGVTNLFIHDAENNPEGFNVQHVAPLTGLGQPLLYFDDSNSSVGGTTNLNGCSSNCHSWSSNFGDNKTINTWWVTYFENDTIKDLNLNKPQYFAKAEINIDSPINCKGENLVLSPKNVVNGGSSPVYSWWVNDDFINNSSTFSPLQLNDQDSISLVLSSSDPCTANDTVSLIIEVPTLSITSKDTSICKGDSILLTTNTVSNASDLTYTWTPSTTLSESTKTSTLAFPTATQNYKIVVSNGKGCKDSSNILLTVHDLPIGTISQTDTFLCPGEQSTIEISSTSNVSVQWYYSADGSVFQSNSTSLTFATAGLGHYFGVIENAQKCQSTTDTLELKASLVVTNPVISLNGSNSNDNELKWCISNALDLKGNTPLVSNQEYGSWFVSSGDTMFSTSSTDPDLGSIVFAKSGAFELNWTIDTDLPNCGNDTASIKIVVYEESNAQLTLSTYDTCQFLDTLKITSSALNLTESGTWESNPLPKPLNAEANSWYVLGKDLTIGENSFTWKVSNNVCPISRTSSKVQIEANRVPKITLNPDLTLCQGSSIEEIAIVENGGSNPTFEWLFTGDTIGKTINSSNKHALSAIINEGTLSVKLTSNERCAIPTTAQDSMKVNVVLAPNPFLEINGDSTICENNPIEINAFDLNTHADTKYTWLRNSIVLNETSLQFRNVNISGIYSLKADNGICPEVEVPLTLNLDVKILPKVDANTKGGNTLEAISGESLYLNGTHTGTEGFWRTDNLENPIKNPLNLNSEINTNTIEKKYTIELVASNGPCVVSDFVHILLHQPLRAPNVFTANGDGINETFKIIGLETYANARVIIFNRWGGLMYDTREYSAHEWDGGEAPEGVYYYEIELDEKDISKNHTGVVHLIR